MGNNQYEEKARSLTLTYERHRKLGKIWKPISAIFTLLAILFSINEIFRLGIIVYHEFLYFYCLLGVFLSIAYLLYPISKRTPKDKIPWYDIILFLLTLVCCSYLMVNSFKISIEGWVMVGPPISVIVSIILWILVLEALRRSGGLTLFIFAGVFSLFPLVAEHMPSFLEGTGWSFIGTAKFHAMSRESIIGIPVQTFCELVIGFILFGITLQETGGSLFFTNFAYAVLGGVRGGPAKVSVVASSLFGSISGSAVSNVLVDGYITIPTMIRSGYKPPFAAAVEACASSGGCIMPPVMGSVAFVMASFLNVPYADVALAALVPALLYYWGLFVQIDAHAAKIGLVGLPRKELPSLKETLKEGWIYLFGIAGLVYLLFQLKQEAQAPYYASLMLLAGASLRKETRPNLKTFYNLLINSTSVLAELVVVMAGVGLIIGAFTMTGVAISFSSELVQVVGNNSLLLLIAGAVVSFILGMGMTITACYIFLAIVLIPALTPLGFDVMAIHLFVLYCGLFSFITPPVALAAYVAASIVGANFWQTGFQAMRLGFVKYIVPFLFVYNPALILHGKNPLVIIEAVATGFIGVFLLGSSIEGYMAGVGMLNVIYRGLFFIAGILLFIPEPYTDIIGFVLAGILFLSHVWLRRKTPQAL
jgi:TRAP transporter 4TM/12TM fusion protein